MDGSLRFMIWPCFGESTDGELLIGKFFGKTRIFRSLLPDRTSTESAEAQLVEEGVEVVAEVEEEEEIKG